MNTIEKSKNLKEEKMVEKGLVEQVRKDLIKELKDAIGVYNKNGDWINNESCFRLIEDLEKGRPTTIRGPLWGDFLDAVLYNLGIRSQDGTGKYEAIRQELEKSKK